MNNEEKKPLLEFPCEFTFKVMGKNLPAFERGVRKIIKQHFPGSKHTFRKRASKDSNFLALSIQVQAESQRQLNDTYKALSTCEYVMVTL